MKPVVSRVAIRNPLFERSLIYVSVYGVPYGWRIHFPHAWVWLDGKAEKHLDLIVMPFLDYWEYEKEGLRKDVEVRISGYLLRHYEGSTSSEVPPPSSRLFPIGGVLNDIRIRREAEVSLFHERDGEPDEWTVALGGSISPSLSGQRVMVELLDPMGRRRVEETTTDAKGCFRATFDLRYEPSPKADRARWVRAAELERGTFRASAAIFNATEAADTASDFVFVPR